MLSRWSDVASEMTGPRSIMQMFIQLRMTFFLMVLIFFFHSPRLAQFSENVFALLLHQARDVYQFPGNKWNQQKGPVTIEHIFTGINSMSLLQFDTV